MISAMIDYRKYPVPRSRHHVSPNLYQAADRISPAYRETMLARENSYPPLYTAENLDWSQLFADGQPPRQLDIGCGMGRFLLEMSLANAENTGITVNTESVGKTEKTTLSNNFLGLEVRKYAVDWINGVISGEQLPNAACLWYNVANRLAFVPSDSIQRLFYFFPDPWFKRRHHGRRAFTPEFLDECARVLAKSGGEQHGGVMYLMTDVPDVDEYQRGVMAQHGRFDYEVCEHNASGDAAWGLPVRTNQEEFSRKKNIPYVRLKCWLRG
jgi:tRNA (guanine-N7-)-methyltransferase